MLTLALLFHTLGSSQACGSPNLTGPMYIVDASADCAPLEHVCTVDEWPGGWTASVCCSSMGCRFSPTGVCEIGESPRCGIIPEPTTEPWLCNPIGTLDAYVSEADSCGTGEIHVCTHGETPPDPLVLVCCVDVDECRLVAGDGACGLGEWLGCGHA
jgi:hypothetical protein